MKKNVLLPIATATLLSFSTNYSTAQGLAVNTSGAAPVASAMLDVSATDKGMLTPRMTNAQRNAIASPATGLLIFQTDGTPGFYYYSGSAWTAVAGATSAGWGLSGNSGTSASSNFVGTTDGVPLRFRVNNEWVGEVTAGASVSLGQNAGKNQSASVKNTAVGTQSLATNVNGDFNVAIGYQSLNLNTGYANTAIGYQSLAVNRGFGGNTGVGYQSLASNTDGNGNTATGYQSLTANTTGTGNTGTGNYTVYANTTGSSNSGFGGSAIQNNTTGNSNSACGYVAMMQNTTGNSNSAFGAQSLFSNVTGSNNTAVGYNADVSTSNLSNATVIGANAICNASNKVRIGNSSVSVIEGQVAFTSVSDARFKTQIQENVPGLSFIMKLKPVTYHFDTRKYERFVGQADSNIQKHAADFAAAEQILHTGFLAQDVEKAAQEAGFDFSGIHKPQSEKDNYSLAYAEFTVPLVKAVQEQQQTIAALQQAKTTLEKSNTEMRTQLAELVARMQALENAKSATTLPDSGNK